MKKKFIFTAKDVALHLKVKRPNYVIMG